MKKFNLILSILGLFISSVVFADHLEVVKTHKTVEVNASPVEVIQSSIVKFNQLTAVAHSAEMASIFVDEEISPLFDFNYIANEILQVVNTNLSADEVQFFKNKLKKNIIATLLVKLTQASSASFNFVFARPVMGNSIMVKLRVNGYTQFGFYIDLLFHQNKNKKWQIFDVVLNNDSLINYYQKIVLIQARKYGIYKILERI